MRIEKLCAEGGVPWSEDQTEYQDVLVIDGISYQPELLFPNKPAPPADIMSGKSPARVSYSPRGNFAYANVLFPRAAELPVFLERQFGTVYFTTNVVIPVLYSVTRVGEKAELVPWMSYTPAEVITQRAGIELARGHVMVGGLGLGWLLKRIARKPEVERVTLVELSDELLGWYGQKLVADLKRETGKPIDIVRGDALQHIGKHGKEVRHVIDIWPTYPAEVSPEWRAAAKSVKYFWGWAWLPEHYR